MIPTVPAGSVALCEEQRTRRLQRGLDDGDHVEGEAVLVGIEHVGIGSDADLHGYDDMKPEYAKMLRAGQKASYKFRDKKDIEGFDHPQKMYDLTEGLIRRGYTDGQIKGVLGGNFRRLLGQIWG